MTIDERLEKMMERDEALSRKLEMLASLHVELEQQMADGFAEIRARFAETDKRFAEVAARFSETLVFINRLSHVAEAHEQRLDDIEGQ